MFDLIDELDAGRVLGIAQRQVDLQPVLRAGVLTLGLLHRGWSTGAKMSLISRAPTASSFLTSGCRLRALICSVTFLAILLMQDKIKRTSDHH